MIIARTLGRYHRQTGVFGCLVGGALATVGEVRVTGSANADIPIVVLGAGTLVWLARWSPPWLYSAMAVSALIAAIRHGEAAPMLFALAALAVLPFHRRAVTTRAVEWLPRAALVLVIASFARIEGGPFLGASAAFAALVFATFIVITTRRMRRRLRHRVWFALGALALVNVLAVAGFALAAWSGKGDLTAAENEAKAALADMRRGDFATGAEQLHAAESRFRSVKRQLHQPWVYLAALVPGVAQNRATLVDLVDTGTDAIAAAADAADQIDPAALTVKHGAIDLAAVEALQAPVDTLQRSFDRLTEQLDRPTSMWVPRRIARRIDSLRSETERYRGTLQHLVMAVHAAPDLLGAQKPQRYFLAFSSPAETRGLGGYVGNWGILRADHGRLSLERFGRTADLVGAVPANGLSVNLPKDFIARYGEFHILDSTTGRVTATTWKNLTVTPDLPTMATVTMAMWQATFHTQLDGVVMLDPYAVAQLLRYAGPQHIPGYEPAITADNAANFILREQYLAFPSVDTTTRIDALDLLAHQTVTALLGGSLPPPLDLIRDLGPLVQERRLSVWTNRVDQQRMLDGVGLSNRFPPAAGRADFGITLNNAAPNKIDAYLTHTIQTRTRHDSELDIDVVDVTLRLTNTAPSTGLPYYVGGNTTGDPANSAVLYLSMYGPQAAVRATKDGANWPLSATTELGLNVASNYLVVAPGATSTVTVTFIAPSAQPAKGWLVDITPTAQRGGTR